MTITKYFTAADFAAGATTVAKQLPGGVSIRITMERDFGGDLPDPEVYTAEDIAEWEAGEWTFWALDLSVWIGAACIVPVAESIGGVDCVDDQYLNAEHLASLANDLAAAANVPAQVRSFARKAAAAASLLDAS